MTLATVVLEERTAVEKMPLPDGPVASLWHTVLLIIDVDVGGPISPMASGPEFNKKAG